MLLGTSGLTGPNYLRNISSESVLFWPWSHCVCVSEPTITKVILEEASDLEDWLPVPLLDVVVTDDVRIRNLFGIYIYIYIYPMFCLAY